MNIDQILQSIQDFRSQLEVWGVNSVTLWATGAAAALLFVLSLREVAGWFLRVQQVRDEVRGMRSQITQLQRTLEDLQTRLVGSSKPLKAEELVKMADSLRSSPAEVQTKFRLDH